MKIINFFNTLNNKINKYNEISKELTHSSNPFANPKGITIIWVETNPKN